MSPTEWLDMSQERIDAFAAAADDRSGSTRIPCVWRRARVPSGGRIRGRFPVAPVEETALGERAVVEANVECEGADKPVCVAELVVLTVP